MLLIIILWPVFLMNHYNTSFQNGFLSSGCPATLYFILSKSPSSPGNTGFLACISKYDVPHVTSELCLQ